MESKEKMTEVRLSQMGSRISGLLKNADLAQKDLAEYMEVNQSHISQLTRGQLAPSVRWIYELADFFDTTPAYIIDGVVDDGMRTLPKKDDIEAMHSMYKRNIMDADLYIQFLEKKLREVAI